MSVSECDAIPTDRPSSIQNEPEISLVRRSAERPIRTISVAVATTAGVPR